MKCEKCGHDNKGGSQFCVKCGAPLNGKFKKERKLNYKIIALAAVILIILAAAIVFVSSGNENEHEETIIENGTFVDVDGVSFKIPNSGKFVAKNDYYFEFNNHTCAIKEVPHLESADSTRNIESTVLPTHYSGAEPYIINYTGDTFWHGIKIQKEDKWFHISMQTHNSKDALMLFDWMYANNNWVGHK